MQCVENCDSPDPRLHRVFEQPVIQTATMFIGESGCWLVLWLYNLYTGQVRKRSGYDYTPIQHDGAERYTDEPPAHPQQDEEQEDYFVQNGHDDITNGVEAPEDPLMASIASLTSLNAPPAIKPLVPNVDNVAPLHGSKVFLLAIPAICDIIGTTLMNVGLLFVAASIYQMTRGALVLFVGLLSVFFLSRKLFLSQWVALCTVVLGVAVVGLAGVLYSAGEGVGEALSRAFTTSTSADPDAIRTIIGVLIIATAQIFTATQYVSEEWILHRYSLEPIKVVAWEGTFGFTITVIGMIILHFTIGITPAGRGGYFDAATGLRQLFTNREVLISSFAILISIGSFNFFGISVTRSVSATARATIDTCRTLGIWVVSLILGWESFKLLQIVGFALLVLGTFWFNGIISVPGWTGPQASDKVVPAEGLEDAPDRRLAPRVDGTAAIPGNETEP
jgi:multidrug transporter EmrE-like cation transporter